LQSSEEEDGGAEIDSGDDGDLGVEEEEDEDQSGFSYEERRGMSPIPVRSSVP
jgi:hypothetical protein